MNLAGITYNLNSKHLPQSLPVQPEKTAELNGYIQLPKFLDLIDG